PSYLILHASTAVTYINTLPLHDALPIYFDGGITADNQTKSIRDFVLDGGNFLAQCAAVRTYENNTVYGHFHSTLGFADDNSATSDRKSTRLNSSHDKISYEVF